METADLLPYFLPEGILTYFDIKAVTEQDSKLVISLEEKPLSSEELFNRHLHSKGFYPAVEIQDFPIRKRACYFKVKRRRWIDIDTGEPYTRDWDMVAKGTKMTSEFALFLKRLAR
ncbi:MAG: transposase [Flavobacteriaceae bacterium]|nr:transposase [Flavobacteriaceae bacterium]